MNQKITGAPGDNLEDFVQRLATDLKSRRVEYIVAGFFNSQRQPFAMIQEKGRTSWVELNLTDIIETARKLNATGVLLLHNHPGKASDKADLTASEADITTLKQFIQLIEAAGLEYYGDWIVSNGRISEILYQLQNAKIRQSDALLSDIEISRWLNINITNAVVNMTKTSLLHVCWYNISEECISSTNITFDVLKLLMGAINSGQIKRSARHSCRAASAWTRGMRDRSVPPAMTTLSTISRSH